jgi:transcriptional regulator with XRE-family HTH domain
MSETSRLPRYSSSIRRERELRGWSQARLAEELGTTPGTVSNWERGLIMPSAYFRERLLQVFAKDAAQLGLVGEGQEAPDSIPTVAVRGGSQQSPGWSNRARFMAKLEAYWLRGVLEPSLAALPGLKLRLALEPEAVAELAPELLGPLPAPAGLLPEGTSLLDCYDEALGELLLLGEPGAGKTTLLLGLLEDLLVRAREDARHPLPVVFQLASWARQQLPLQDWLLQELRRLYQVPQLLGRAWLQAEQILPLLDGLDEVPGPLRSACIRAINAYRREHGLLPMVVTCRREAYYAQPERLCLQRAVVVQPLTQAYVQAYLARRSEAAGSCASGALDPSLLELITTPFLLNIARETLEAQEKGESSPEERGKQREHLVRRYVEQLLARSQRRYALSPERLRCWLSWIAQQLLAQSQAELLLEQVQASWLPLGSWERRCWKPLTGALAGLIFGLICVPFFGMLIIGQRSTFEAYQAYLEPGLLSGLGAGLATCWLGGACTGRARLIRALLTGAIFALVYGLLVRPVAGLVFGLLAGLLMWARIMRPFEGQIELVEAPSWSWRLLWQRLRGRALLLLCFMALLGFSIGAAFLLVERSSLAVALTSACVVLLFVGLSGGFVAILLGGLSWRVLAAPKFVRPAEGIWRAGRCALLGGLGAMLISLLALVGAVQLASLLGSLIIAALIGSSSFISLTDTLSMLLPIILVLIFPCTAIGLAVAWNYGGATVLLHLLLRLFLSSTGCLPLRAVRHLEMVVAEGLLRRAGGAYLFAHRLLLEHFAAAAEGRAALVSSRQQSSFFARSAGEKLPL